MFILRMPAVKAQLGHRSHVSIYNAISAGLFTKPVSIGERSVGWPQDEVNAINAARIAGQTEAQIRELVKRLHEKRQVDFENISSDTRLVTKGTEATQLTENQVSAEKGSACEWTGWKPAVDKEVE